MKEQLSSLKQRTVVAASAFLFYLKLQLRYLHFHFAILLFYPSISRQCLVFSWKLRTLIPPLNLYYKPILLLCSVALTSSILIYPNYKIAKALSEQYKKPTKWYMVGLQLLTILFATERIFGYYKYILGVF